MTLVTNGGGYGPGHTAIQFDDAVYSFENIADYGSNRSGWVIFDGDNGYDSYMAKNTWRPVILQTINAKVTAEDCIAYIKRSMEDDDDYGRSGFCSSQTASALKAGTRFKFKPPLPVTPTQLYGYLRKVGLVDAENVIWADQSSMPMMTWSGIINRLNADFPVVFSKLDVRR